jgi:hypothetical protein
MTTDIDFDQFTEAGYRAFLQSASKNYSWAFFGSKPSERHIILRHDVDLSPNRALALARIEQEESARSTFLFMLHSDFYNLLERQVIDKVKTIKQLGHRIGLHFDISFYDGIATLEGLAAKLREERRIIETMCEVECDVFSFHNPDTNSSLSFRVDEIGGMINAYASSIQEQYKYVSDSNGYWRFDNLFDVVSRAEHDRLQVLIHPEWWTPEALSPRRRVERAVQGRSQVVLKTYDEILAKWNRLNVA